MTLKTKFQLQQDNFCISLIALWFHFTLVSRIISKNGTKLNLPLSFLYLTIVLWRLGVLSCLLEGSAAWSVLRHWV